MAINRCMLESVNVTYQLAVDTQVYDEFVKKGLGPEREYYGLVQQANIAARGGIAAPMEDRTLQSICG